MKSNISLMIITLLSVMLLSSCNDSTHSSIIENNTETIMLPDIDSRFINSPVRIGMVAVIIPAAISDKNTTAYIPFISSAINMGRILIFP